MSESVFKIRAGSRGILLYIRCTLIHYSNHDSVFSYSSIFHVPVFLLIVNVQNMVALSHSNIKQQHCIEEIMAISFGRCDKLCIL
jgi:hypothetical protein